MQETVGNISDQGPLTGPIVVGVDGSTPSHRALEWAFQEAAARGSAILAIGAYSMPALAASSPGFSVDIAELADGCRAVVAAETSGFARIYPAVSVDSKIVEGPAAQILIDASHRASALVVGSRGHGGFVGLMLGSVSQQCVTHAACPVVVVRPAAA